MTRPPERFPDITNPLHHRCAPPLPLHSLPPWLPSPAHPSLGLEEMTTYRVCFCFRRRFESATNEPPEPIREVFERYSENGMMGPDQLRRFLVEVQGEDGAAAARQGTEEPRHHLHVFQRKGGLSLAGFFRYLLGDDNQPLLSHTLGVHQDMLAPLSHYFIYTGHNSYLTGNQLSSDCSDVPIIKALKKGVRVIELDLWPNSTKDNINVVHGRTRTTPVELIKCLESIKVHAFSASPYPVILTLEDHLTPDLQAKVAKMVTQTFGEVVFRPKPESPEEFPSPEDLKMRIVISTKPPKEYLESKCIKGNVEQPQEEKHSIEEGLWGKEVSDVKYKIHTDSKDDFDQGEHDQYEEEVDEGDQKLVQNEVPEYKQLIAITAIKRKRDVGESLKVEPNRATRLSLNERMFGKATISHGMELIRFTQQNLLRLYPKATRFDSSNYNPLLGWMYGAQMVAFNMQGHGRELWLMQGMFRANGACGFVKKPDILLKNSHSDNIFDPKLDFPVKRTLKVKVYMGDGWRLDFHHTHFDTYSPPDFYTRVGIAGVAADSVMKTTRAIGNSWTPVWNEEFVFPLTVPELALLRIEVHEYDMSDRDDFGGQTCLPVWELRSGIRAVPLYDHRGDKYKNVKLLIHFQFS